MAKTSILTIAIQLVKQGDGDKATVKALAQLRAGFSQAVAIMGAMAGVGVTLNQVQNQTVDVLIKYAAQVRELSRLTGASAEETSRLIQIADDMGISYEGLQKSLWFAAKNGVDVNTQSLGQLSDAYLALEGPTERAEFLAKNFGKSGAEMAKLMERGSAAINQMSDAVEGNLVLTGRAVQQARQYEMALDSVNDSMEGVKIQAGLFLLPLENAILQNISNDLATFDAKLTSIKVALMATNPLLAAFINLTSGTTGGVEASVGAFNSLSSSIRDVAGASKDTSAEYQNLINLTGQVQSVEDAYVNTVRAQFAEQANLNQQLAQGKITQEEYNQRIAEAGAAVTQAAAEHEAASNRILFTIIQMKMAADGLSQAEGDALINIGVELGVFTKESADKAKGYMQKADEMIASSQNAGTAINQAFQPAMDALSDTKEQAHGLKEQLDSIEKKNGKVVVFTVIINTVGSVPNLPSAGGNSEACFVAGTLVEMADGSQKPIEQVRAGDRVRSADLERGGALIEAEVVETFEHAPETIPSTLRINGLGVTGEHLLYVNHTWLPADQVRVGDYLQALDGSAVRVESVEQAEGGVAVYNLHTNHRSHNYFAGGVLVHNAKRNESSTSSYYSGGRLPLGEGWSVVGDGPGGQWTPYSELIDPNGVVYSNKDSQALMRAGLVPDNWLREGGATPSADEAAYYRTVYPRNASGRRPRRGGGGSPITRRGGADESGQVTPVSPVDPIVTATNQNTSAMTQAAQAQTNAAQQQTSAIERGNSDVVAAMNAMREEVRRLNTTIPQAVKEAAMQVV